MTTVVLTRPKGKNDRLAQALRQLGVQSVELPALAIARTFTVLPQDYDPQGFDLLIFVSAQAAQFYLEALTAAGKTLAAGTRIATVGAASAQPFYQQHKHSSWQLIHPPASHPRQDSEALWVLLQPLLPDVQRVLLVRGQQGREWLSQQLLGQGKILTRCCIYQRLAAQWSAKDAIQLQPDLVKPQSVVFLLTSSESTRSIYHNIVRLGWESLWQQAQFVAIHPRIADCLIELSAFTPAQAAAQIHVCAPTETAMLEALRSVALP